MALNCQVVIGPWYVVILLTFLCILPFYHYRFFLFQCKKVNLSKYPACYFKLFTYNLMSETSIVLTVKFYFIFSCLLKNITPYFNMELVVIWSMRIEYFNPCRDVPMYTRRTYRCTQFYLSMLNKKIQQQS